MVLTCCPLQTVRPDHVVHPVRKVRPVRKVHPALLPLEGQVVLRVHWDQRVRLSAHLDQPAPMGHPVRLALLDRWAQTDQPDPMGLSLRLVQPVRLVRVDQLDP